MGPFQTMNVRSCRSFFTQGGATSGCVGYFVEAGNLPVYKKNSFCIPRLPLQNLIWPTFFQDKKALARFKKDIWCIELADVDELTKHINGVKYLLYTV